MNAAKPHAKDRWSSEEKAIMARKEAELTRAGHRFINQLLHDAFPNRSLEAIKGQRRKLSHKNRVANYLEGLQTSSDDSDAFLSADEEPSVDEAARAMPNKKLEEYFKNLRLLDESKNALAGKINDICSLVNDRNWHEIIVRLGLFIKEVLPADEPKEKVRRSSDMREALTRKKRRREHYARTQDLWKKDPSRCVRRILEDQLEQDAGIDKEIMEPYWRAVFSKNCYQAPSLRRDCSERDPLWAPIAALEIKQAYPPAKTAYGPDGITAKTLRSANSEIMARIFNLLMICKALPEKLYESRTILIPKKKGASDPGDYRPITVSSVVTRTLHKILANRLKSVDLDERQRGFISTDGCADNTILLDIVIRFHKERHRPLYLASLDMRKAFDSVTFGAIKEVLNAKGLPSDMIEYISNMYNKSVTTLQHAGWKSDKINPTCGVKQGDPLSSYIFNFVIDELLRRIPPEIGVDIDGLRVNILAFADDLVLVASSEKGLQLLIDMTADFLYTCGLEANAGKCVSVAYKSVPREKKIIINNKCTFTIRGVRMTALSRDDQWKYLGLKFNSNGITMDKVRERLKEMILKITKAPLKPQQRLWAMKTILVPSILYQLTLGKTTLGYLKSIDKLVRKSVRAWLYLPHECPNAYIHASVKSGGLGIPSLRWKATKDRIERLKKIRSANYIEGSTAINYIKKEVDKAIARATEGNIVYDSNEKIEKRWMELLYKSVDGIGLKDSEKVTNQHSWVSEPTRFLKGRDFVNCVKMRINALPTKTRTARGRMKDRYCRGGCGMKETLNHILQHCHRTHDGRIARHNAVVEYVKRRLESKSYKVEEEPHIKTSTGLLKPDLLATIGETTVILDAQVRSDQADLDKLDREKKRKYGCNKELVEEIKKRTGSKTIVSTSITLNWRGVWSKRSAEELIRKGILNKDDLKVISSRVLIGGLAEWWVFNRRTSADWRRRRKKS